MELISNKNFLLFYCINYLFQKNEPYGISWQIFLVFGNVTDVAFFQEFKLYIVGNNGYLIFIRLLWGIGVKFCTVSDNPNKVEGQGFRSTADNPLSCKDSCFRYLAYKSVYSYFQTTALRHRPQHYVVLPVWTYVMRFLLW